MNTCDNNNGYTVSAVILAGGAGRRVQGQDKGWLELAGTPLIKHVLQRLQPQCQTILISANRNVEAYRALGYPVLPDLVSDYAGPLAGIYTALQHCTTQWLLCVTADSPFIPLNLCQRLLQHAVDQHVDVAIASDGEALQPTFCLLRSSLADSLNMFLQSGQRKTGYWLKQQSHCIVDFSDAANAFFNINTEQDLHLAQTLLTPA